MDSNKDNSYNYHIQTLREKCHEINEHWKNELSPEENNINIKFSVHTMKYALLQYLRHLWGSDEMSVLQRIGTQFGSLYQGFCNVSMPKYEQNFIHDDFHLFIWKVKIANHLVFNNEGIVR